MWDKLFSIDEKVCLIKLNTTCVSKLFSLRSRYFNNLTSQKHFLSMIEKGEFSSFVVFNSTVLFIVSREEACEKTVVDTVV